MNARKWVLRILPWLLLWAAFAAFGAWVRSVQPWPEDRMVSIELYALDYRRYAQMLEGWDMIFYAAFRHPLYGWLMAPVIGMGARFRELGEVAFWGWLIAFFSAVMTAAHFLVYWLLRRLALGAFEAGALTALFASFAASWLLGACPESFNISCLLALGTLHFALYVHRHKETMNPTHALTGWGFLALLTGGITSTQVVKTAIAYFVTNRPNLKRIALIGIGIFAAGILVGVVFSLRLYLRAQPGCFTREFLVSLNNIGVSLDGDGMDLLSCLGRVLVFFTEPIVTRGMPFAQKILPTSYGALYGAVLALLPPLAAVVSAFAARKDFLVRLIAAMFLVDIAIHFVLFWGMTEAQIYAGHWYYAIPLLIGCGMKRLSERMRKVASAALVGLSVCLASVNLLTWLGAR